MIDHALQVLIALITFAGLWMVLDGGAALVGWGYVVSLASQPLWLVATWRKRQYGMFIVALFYAGLWTRGVFNYF